MTHARPVYRPGIRRRLGHIRDLAALLLRTGLLFSGGPHRLIRHLRALRRWGTTLAGLSAAAAARSPSRAALIDDEGALTFAELDERAARLAAGLPLQGPRPRVGVLCRNHRGMVETLVACSRRGAEVILLNTGFGTAQLKAVLTELRPGLLVADAEFAPLLRTLPVTLRRTVLWADRRPDPPQTMPLSAPVPAGTLAPPPRMAPEPPPLPRAERGPCIDEIIASVPASEAARGPGSTPPQIQGRTIMLSSGTTGRPKGARRPPRPGLWPLASMTSRIPLRSRHTMIIEAPLFHTWGYAALQMAWALRATVVLHRRFDPERTLAALASHRQTTLFVVPVMLQRILELPPEVRAAHDASSLRVAAVSGAPMPGNLATRFMDEFGDRLYNVYGSTETSWVSIATPRDLRIDPRTAGRPPRNTSLAIFGDDGRRLDPPAIGHIFAANELPFEGYTGGEPTEVRDGLLATGDLGHIGERGLLFVDGRADGLVVSGGEKIVPRDVEDALLRLPEIGEVAVVGVHDHEWGQRLAAYIVLRPGARLDPDAVRDYVHEEVARYAVPRDIYFVPELPRNATGKVVYRWLSPDLARRRPEGHVAWPSLGAGRTG